MKVALYEGAKVPSDIDFFIYDKTHKVLSKKGLEEFALDVLNVVDFPNFEVYVDKVDEELLAFINAYFVEKKQGSKRLVKIYFFENKEWKEFTLFE